MRLVGEVRGGEGKQTWTLKTPIKDYITIGNLIPTGFEFLTPVSLFIELHLQTIAEKKRILHRVYGKELYKSWVTLPSVGQLL